MIQAPGLIFEGKASNLTYMEAPERCCTLVGSGLTRRSKVGLMLKLIRLDEEKLFYNFWPRSSAKLSTAEALKEAARQNRVSLVSRS